MMKSGVGCLIDAKQRKTLSKRASEPEGAQREAVWQVAKTG